MKTGSGFAILIRIQQSRLWKVETGYNINNTAYPHGLHCGSEVSHKGFKFVHMCLDGAVSTEVEWASEVFTCLFELRLKICVSKVCLANFSYLKSTYLITGRPFLQCCGSGSTGSTCFWASCIRIHQSQVWIWIRILLWIRIRILLSSCKNTVVRKPLIRNILWLLWLFIFEKWRECSFKN